MVWLSEAAAETYVPLWRVFNRIREKGQKAAITIGVSPVLAEQLRDPVFKDEFNHYLQMKREAAELDKDDFEEKGEVGLAKTAQFWIDYYRDIQKDFKGSLNQDIIGAFKELQDSGTIEIITCGATHGYLPLLGTEEAVNAQVELAVNSYKKYFGRDPKGIWLPECAYRPGYKWTNPTDPDAEGFERQGVEKFLKKHGLKYFIIDSHLLKGGKAVGTYLARFEGLRQLWEQSQQEKDKEFNVAEEREPYRVYWVDGTVGDGDPVGILTRDPETSLQVWSGEYGYPGDGNYLDFHKKHFPGGHRYWRVTRASADLGEKEEYNIDKIEGRVQENSDHFLDLLKGVLENSATDVNERQVVCPFDTELFGHWWFEGPRWLENVLNQLNDSESIDIANGSELVTGTKEAPVVALPEGSWGEGGFHYIWLNEKTEFYWPLVHSCEKHMTELARKYANTEGELKELLQQLGRELLLLESSDWPFLISTIAAADYAEIRIREHHKDFEFLRSLVDKVADGTELSYDELTRYTKIKEQDNLFDDLDISIWA